jgi:hypothetical protein
MRSLACASVKEFEPFAGAVVSLAFDVAATAGLWLGPVVFGGATVAFGGLGGVGVVVCATATLANRHVATLKVRTFLMLSSLGFEAAS